MKGRCLGSTRSSCWYVSLASDLRRFASLWKEVGRRRKFWEVGVNVGSRMPPLRRRMVCWPALRAAMTGAHSLREIIDVADDAWHTNRCRFVIYVFDCHLVKKLGEKVAILVLITQNPLGF